MSAIVISAKGQIVLSVVVRKALGLKPGMRVNVKVEGKSARLTLAKNTATLEEIQSLLKCAGPVVPIRAIRVTDYKAG